MRIGMAHESCRVDDNAADSDADMESPAGNAPMGAQEMQRFDTPVRIRVTHYRHRLCDADGPSIKAALDGIVQCGILADDSTKEIHEISHQQVKIPRGQEEKTEFRIEAILT